MKNILFLDAPATYTDPSEFVAYLPGVKGGDELYDQLNDALKFPYFGFNWNALYDLLRDFHWINKKGIALVHREMPDISNEDWKVYLEVLVDSVADWKEGEEHYFKVIFPKAFKETIERMILEIDRA
jgi:hypothetical protein